MLPTHPVGLDTSVRNYDDSVWLVESVLTDKIESVNVFFFLCLLYR